MHILKYMSRPQRDRKQTVQFKPSNAPLQPQKPKEPEKNKPEKVEKPVKIPKEPARTLNLKLVKVNARDYDPADPDDPFYDEFFYNPEDDVTERLDDLDYSAHSFTIGLQSGITNYELKDIDKIPLKPVLFSKFKAKEYETGRSKSDATVYTAKINKFMNQFPSFNQYKSQDDLTWVVRKHRLLICELLEYAIPRDNKLPSIESEIVAIMRVMFLALGTKEHPLYIKMQTILGEMRGDTRTAEGENKLNQAELKRGGIIPWDTVLGKQRELQIYFNRIENKKTQEGYFLNQELLLVSLYSLIPPLRNEVKVLEFTKTKQKKGNYVYIKDDNTVTLDLIDEKKKHNSIELKDLPSTLQNILRASYVLYPRQYVFTDSLQYPVFTKKASLSTMNQRLQNLFKGYKNQDGIQYKVGASMLRSSYVTYRYQQQLKYNVREWIATQMRTSVEMMERQYLKILTEPAMASIAIPEKVTQGVARPVQGQITKPIVINNVGIPVKPIMIVQKGEAKAGQDDIQEKRNEASKRYYHRHKEDLLPDMKKYRKEHKVDDSRRKILKFLNTDPDYSKKIRETTVKKYNIQQVNGQYISVK